MTLSVSSLLSVSALPASSLSLSCLSSGWGHTDLSLSHYFVSVSSLLPVSAVSVSSLLSVSVSSLSATVLSVTALCGCHAGMGTTLCVILLCHLLTTLSASSLSGCHCLCLCGCHGGMTAPCICATLA